MSRVRIVFKRMERDDEYTARLQGAGVLTIVWPSGVGLDALGDSHGKPRRIVEDVQS